VTPRFRSVVLDVDSTLCAIEGIDWLARRRGPAVAAQVAALTDRAMDGAIALDQVYGERLALIRPGRDDIAAVAAEYVRTVLPDAATVVGHLRAAGVTLVLVSGGLRQGILPMARELGFRDADVHAVDVRLDTDGAYAGFDAASPLATQAGKPVVVGALALPRPSLAVGDGSTDLALAGTVDVFAAFTGVVRREAVAHGAACELTSFAQLLSFVLS